MEPFAVCKFWEESLAGGLCEHFLRAGLCFAIGFASNPLKTCMVSLSAILKYYAIALAFLHS